MSEYTLIITYMEGDKYVASEQFELTPFIPIKPMFVAPEHEIARYSETARHRQKFHTEEQALPAPQYR